jgi:hypothetical protein
VTSVLFLAGLIVAFFVGRAFEGATWRPWELPAADKPLELPSGAAVVNEKHGACNCLPCIRSRGGTVEFMAAMAAVRSPYRHPAPPPMIASESTLLLRDLREAVNHIKSVADETMAAVEDLEREVQEHARRAL